MKQGSIGCLRVAALLISASYGIGFLFGSGELALRIGMAGSLYAVATALGMTVLAFIAPRLWRDGRAIWDVLGEAFGPAVHRSVALLSFVWMTGVLAAQIQGGVAVLGLLGAPRPIAYSAMLALVVLASGIELKWASTAFACLLVGSNLVLFDVIFRAGSVGLYLHAPLIFAHDIRQLPPADTLITVLAVGFLVVTGADYQQFIFVARRSVDAWFGCLLAASFLLLTGFAPAAAVIATGVVPGSFRTVDAKAIVPLILTHAATPLGAIAQASVLLVLLGAALGSGSAITRAMTAALMSQLNGSAFRLSTGRRLIFTTSTGLLAALIAMRGQAIVDTMVALNIVYIASVGVMLIRHALGFHTTRSQAQTTMAVGFLVALLMYVVSSTLTPLPAYAPLIAGLGVSCLVAAFADLARRCV